MGRKQTTGDVLNARAKTNGYKRGAHREEDSRRDCHKHKNQIRVDLPFEIKGQAATLESEVIQAIVEKCVPEEPDTSQSKPFPIQHIEDDNSSKHKEQNQEHIMAAVSLTGYVCELTIEDAQAVTVSDQIHGKIWLTYPYNTSSMPFLTIPITPEFARQYVEMRPQIIVVVPAILPRNQPAQALLVKLLSQGSLRKGNKALKQFVDKFKKLVDARRVVQQGNFLAAKNAKQAGLTRDHSHANRN